jgi:hypothetical protein
VNVLTLPALIEIGQRHQKSLHGQDECPVIMIDALVLLYTDLGMNMITVTVTRIDIRTSVTTVAADLRNHLAVEVPVLSVGPLTIERSTVCLSTRGRMSLMSALAVVVQ